MYSLYICIYFSLSLKVYCILFSAGCLAVREEWTERLSCWEIFWWFVNCSFSSVRLEVIKLRNVPQLTAHCSLFSSFPKKPAAAELIFQTVFVWTERLAGRSSEFRPGSDQIGCFNDPKCCRRDDCCSPCQPVRVYSGVTSDWDLRSTISCSRDFSVSVL